MTQVMKNEGKSLKRSQVLNEFLKGLKSKEENNQSGQFKYKEDEFEDPFEKVENEYQYFRNYSLCLINTFYKPKYFVIAIFSFFFFN